MYTYRFDIIALHPEEHKLSNEFMLFSQNDHAKLFESKIYWLQSEKKIDHCDLNYMATEILSDPLLEKAYFTKNRIHFAFDQFIEISFKPGVRDNRAQSTKDAIQITYPQLDFIITTGNGYFVQGDVGRESIDAFAKKYLCNTLLNNTKVYLRHDFDNERFEKIKIPSVNLSKEPTEYIDLDISDERLMELSHKRCLALSLGEMQQIKKYAKSRNENNAMVSDVELEILAQTWSEHCKHKIFAAKIDYTEAQHQYKALPSKKINSLYKEYIKKSTNDLKEKRPWLRSVFSDNAGVVRFDEKYDLCIKVETHNSPCALDPYGGALTGILGVNRDIMGTGLGAQTIANMDVFCTGFPKKEYTLPPKLMEPSRILSEVHKGVEDGGNKSGIPTINGSMHFHDNWVGKPLIYVGSVGMIPHKLAKTDKDPVSKNQKAGDLIIIAGGLVGADGIHGATFSSMELKDDALSTFVQIGDPYTQKKLADFLIAARDRNLYTSITDNGAGGLSSSIGEMAELSNGANIYLDRALLKYPGLKNFEIMISESQERMTLSVEKEKFAELCELAKTYEVDIVNMGEFTDSGYLKVYDKDELCAELDLNFMHNGLEQLELKAHFDPQSSMLKNWMKKDSLKFKDDLQYLFENLLAHPNIASKEQWVRQYDHEVKAQTILKPYAGKSQQAPSDAGIINMQVHGGSSNIAISNGLDTLFAMQDTYLSTHYALDEAIRNLIASGGDIDHLALLDNFCWPDPIKSEKNLDGEHKLALLVRANHALKEACEIYQTPLVSGKDSMKNDFYGNDINGEKIKISSQPTLLITGMSKNKSIIKNHFERAGELIYLIGHIEKDLYKSHFTEMYGLENKFVHPYSLERNNELYQNFTKLHPYLNACHDISEGGLLSALFEMCLADELGAELLPALSLGELFNEPLGSFIVSINPENKNDFEEALSGFHFTKLGTTINERSIKLNRSELSINELNKYYQGAFL